MSPERTKGPAVQDIPLIDWSRIHDPILREINAAIDEVQRGGCFIGGPICDRFAANLAQYIGVEHCVPCGSGSDALYLAVRAALGLGDGEGEIITVAHAPVGTAEAVANAGYQPILIDINPKTYVMDAAKVEAAITTNTKAIVPVHLYGQMAPIMDLAEIAGRHGLALIEDVGYAHGAAYGVYQPGQLSTAAAFSFGPCRGLGGWGQAGAVATNDGDVARRVRMLADHGRCGEHNHRDIGLESRMDAIQAAVLDVKLGHLDAWNASVQRVAEWYHNGLSDLDEITRPFTDPKARHVYARFVIAAANRDEVLGRFHRNGIGAVAHYPVPIHEQPAFEFLGRKPTELPVTHEVGEQLISLPIFPGMTRDEVARVCEAVGAPVAV
jgi:dTDP-4-amino-4,6-dideoxygalactose transaminase